MVNMSSASHLENTKSPAWNSTCAVQCFLHKLDVPAATVGFAVIILFYVKKKKILN